MDWEGGGFINDSIADEPQQLTTSVSVAGEDKNKSVTSVSISQIVKLTRPNEGLIIHGKKIYHVNLVAFVYEIIDNSSLKIHLLLDDFTSGGPLEASHIMGDTGAPGDDHGMSNMNGNDEDQGRDLTTLKQGDYVRCIGVVKFNQDKPTLVAYNMRIVDDPNEVTMHNLEVIRDSMFLEKLQSGAVPLATSVTTNNDTNRNNNFNYNNQANNEFGKLSTRDKHIMKFLKEKSNDRGIRVDTIVENFKAFSKSDILASLETLSSEGLCWQGDQEDIWCANAD